MKEIIKFYQKVGFTAEQMIMVIKGVNRLGFTVEDVGKVMEKKREKDHSDEDRH